MVGSFEKKLREVFEHCEFRKHKDENSQQEPESTRYKFQCIAKDIIANNYDYFKKDINKYLNEYNSESSNLSYEEIQSLAFAHCVDKEMKKMANRYGDYNMNKSYTTKSGNKVIYSQSKTTLNELEMYCDYLNMIPDEIFYKQNDNIHEHIYNAKDFMAKVRMTDLKKKEIYMPIISDMLTGITMYAYINWKSDKKLDQKLNEDSTIKNDITYFVSSVTYQYRSFEDAYKVFVSDYKWHRKVLFNGTKKIMKFSAENLILDDETEGKKSGLDRKEPNYFRKMRLFMKDAEDAKDDKQLKNSIKALYGEKKYIKDVFYRELDKKLELLSSK